MTGRIAAVLALLFAPGLSAADDLTAAARELGRRTATAVGTTPVAVTWRNLSSTLPDAVAQARTAFESSVRVGEGPGAEAQMTISENASSGLLIEQLRRGEDQQVWMVSFKRVAGAGPAAAVTIEKRLLWEDDEPILDIAPYSDGFLVLTPTALVRTATRQRIRLTAAKPWPRDVRGRLRVNAGAVQVHLPGLACAGSLAAELTLTCGSSDEPWTLDSGRALLLATYAAGRNYFDGRVVTQNGARKTVPPFYTAAAAGSYWLLSLTDGQAAIFDAAFDRAGSIPGWGSDLAAANMQCGGAPVVLATRPGEIRDALQAYAITGGGARPLGQPLEFNGPVTALWPGVAVVRNGRFQAYAISVVCAP